eukprot:6019111-Pyramimonas_sp.AAC.1
MMRERATEEDISRGTYSATDSGRENERATGDDFDSHMKEVQQLRHANCASTESNTRRVRSRVHWPSY